MAKEGTVRLKMLCEKNEIINEGKQDEYANITLTAVTDGSPENNEFYRWTPAGHLEMFCVNKEASKKIKVGEHYCIDITSAE